MLLKAIKRVENVYEVESHLASSNNMANTELEAEALTTGKIITLDPVLRQVIEEITENISLVINQKVDTL